MIRVGIVGCGRIAEQHAELIRHIPGSELVSTCDSEALMAQQLCERFGGESYFSDVEQLIRETRPDVIHITTPPESHFALTKLCLEAGRHVYVEKPFTVDAAEAEELVRIAEQANLRITAGHNAQFTHAAVRMRDLVRGGYLGGDPVHMESVYCYDLGDARYARAVLGDKNHWVRRLPGRLLHNIISHGICKIAEFMKGDDFTVVARGFTSPLLTDIGETDIIDELRVIIDGHGFPTSYFTFSSQMNPVLHQFRLYGPKNSLIVDDDNQTVIKVKGGKYKSYLNHFVPPLGYARQYVSNWAHNLMKFVKRDFHMTHGMRRLIHSFHRSISEDVPLPISHREIVLTARIMDSIFAQI